MNNVRQAARNFLLLTLPFFVLIWLLPASKVTMELYHVNEEQYHALLFFVYLPLVVVWASAFYAYAKLAEFVISIRDTKEEAGFDKLLRGTKWLVWGLPLTTIGTSILNGIAHGHLQFHPTAIILGNYFYLIFTVVAFTLISEATTDMVKKAKVQLSIVSGRLLQLVFVISGIIYCILIFRHININSLNTMDDPYYLPLWLIVITLILPYLFAGFVGLRSAFSFAVLANQSPGLLYRQALRLLSAGLIFIIVSLAALQYLRSVVPRTGHLTLNSALLGTYIIYAVTAIGFVLLSFGASKLKRFEEV